MIFGFQLFISVTLMIENLKKWGFHMDLQFITDFRQKKTCHKICLEIRKPVEQQPPPCLPKKWLMHLLLISGKMLVRMNVW